ncbi:MAG: DNA mismatch repair endonuclease MutL [Oscillospiraceae bacterium]|nr:DNA mismatch repair endonuclease MutL [Oscillospiraceae bacterium]
MGKINILSKAAAEKIAAGEVVERPANAVKEMVENSIDAGAKSVTVEVRRGGVSYIRITDDGGGILPDDAERAFMRHATSKIKDETDLEHITTLGFRGEALCSIASVSRTEMTTKTPQSSFGTHIVVEGGEIVVNEETGCPDGTSVVVENLFFNTPARMKFLKKDSAEAALVTEVCQRQALSRPDVSIRLIREGKEVFFTPGNNSLSDAVRCLWGKDISENMEKVDYRGETVRVTGLVGKNNLSRPSRSMQVFFVNGRSVGSRALSLALAEAYKNELMSGRFPVAVLNVELNPALCDVNVHPTKTEVKFADERAVYNTVYWAVKNTLAKASGAGGLRPSAQESYKLPFTVRQPEQISIRPAVKAQTKPELKPEAEKPSGGKFRQYTPTAPERKPISSKEDKEIILKTEISPLLPKKQVERLDEETERRLKSGEIKSPIMNDTEPENPKTPEPEVEEAQKPTPGPEEKQEPETELPIRIIGQLFSTYILAEAEGEFILIDQHAAHERIRYEALKSSEEKNTMQLLMLPQNVSLSPSEFTAVMENRDFLWDMGFDLEDVGGNTVMIRSVPSDCSATEGESLLGELAGVLMGGGSGSIADRRDKAMYTLACHSAIRANRDLTVEEMERLTRDALRLDGISTCPHGRPIAVKMSKYRIEKMFKRIV